MSPHVQEKTHTHTYNGEGGREGQREREREREHIHTHTHTHTHNVLVKTLRPCIIPNLFISICNVIGAMDITYMVVPADPSERFHRT